MINGMCGCSDGWNEERNQFNPENRFIGDIEDGKRYPYGIYSKEESDKRYAEKAIEDDVRSLEDIVIGKADETEVEDIRKRLDSLEYSDIKINTFTATPAVAEIGSTQTISLAWALNKVATTINVNGTPVTDNSKQFTGVSSNTSYTLNVSDGKTNASKVASVSFANRIYYGAAADLSAVTELASALSDNPQRTITVSAGLEQHIIYAMPVRLGDVAFYVGGFEGGFEEPALQTLTNSSGYQELYKVYRSKNANLGSTTVEIKRK